jgi:hypothetical protein
MMNGRKNGNTGGDDGDRERLARREVELLTEQISILSDSVPPPVSEG